MLTNQQCARLVSEAKVNKDLGVNIVLRERITNTDVRVWCCTLPYNLIMQWCVDRMEWYSLDASIRAAHAQGYTIKSIVYAT